MAGLDQALAGVTRWIGTNLLIDTVRVTRPGTAEPVLNTSTGELEYPDGGVLYEGPGAVVTGASTTEGISVPEAAAPWIQQTRAKFTLLTPLPAPIPPEGPSLLSCRSTTRRARRCSGGAGCAPALGWQAPSRSSARRHSIRTPSRPA